jgi:hypothetical protein
VRQQFWEYRNFTLGLSLMMFRQRRLGTDVYQSAGRSPRADVQVGCNRRLDHTNCSYGLDLVDGLRLGQTAARKTCKVRGIDYSAVQATLPTFLQPYRP